MEQSPERLWNSQPLKYWNLGWKGPELPAQAWKWTRLQSWLCPGVGLEQMSSGRSFQLKFFYASVIQIWNCCTETGGCAYTFWRTEHTELSNDKASRCWNYTGMKAEEEGRSSKLGWDGVLAVTWQLFRGKLYLNHQICCIKIPKIQLVSPMMESSHNASQWWDKRR